MSRAQSDGPDRANENGDRTLLRRGASTAVPVSHSLRVTAIGHVEEDDLAAGIRCAIAQIVEAADNEEIRFEATRGC
jgi:hypothetical protein